MNMSNPRYTTWMIVYTPNKERVANFNHINNTIPTKLFVAIDTVSQFDKYSNMAIDQKYCTPEYIQSVKKCPGKLGCNLSHQLLLEEIQQNSPTDWNLVLEDDTVIYSPLFLKDVGYTLGAADSCGSHYIQSYSHKRFRNNQRKYNKIGDNVYNMMRQWGTCAYFIHKDGIPKIQSIYPVARNIDFVYCSLLNQLKALCWLTHSVKTIGPSDAFDTNSLLNSIILSDNMKVRGGFSATDIHWDNLHLKDTYAEYVPNKDANDVKKENDLLKQTVTKTINTILDQIISKDQFVQEE